THSRRTDRHGAGSGPAFRHERVAADVAAGGAAGHAAVDGGGVRQELSRGADLYLVADAGADHPQPAAVVHADQGTGVDVCGAAAWSEPGHHATAARRWRDRRAT